MRYITMYLGFRIFRWIVRRPVRAIVFGTILTGSVLGSVEQAKEWLLESIGGVGGAQAQSHTAARVIDGDTIEWNAERVRLEGIDAPESAQTCTGRDGRKVMCGQLATSKLRELIEGRALSCRQSARDRYGRMIATCRTSDGDVNRKMVQSGWALAYRRYSNKYVNDEDQARWDGRGLWSMQFEKPWEWRRK